MSQDDDADIILERGEWGHVVVAKTPGGELPALQFLDGLDAQSQAQFKTRTERLAALGKIVNKEQFHHLEHDQPPRVWEIKLTPGPGYRFYCIQEGRRWVVTHGTKKPKNNKRYAPEIKRAQQIYSERRGNR